MDVSELQDGQCLRVPLAVLVDAPWGNVRRGKRNPSKFGDLKSSIAGRGVVQGITVRPNDDDNTLETLAGYGRRDASRELGLADIPVVVKRVDDKEGIAIGLTENLQREDLTIRDEVVMSQQFVSLADGDYAEAARALGWGERKVRARIKLNDCSAKVLEALAEGTIKIGHAEVLCQFTHNLQDGTLAKLLDEGWSVEYLKERANQASRILRFAKFDTSACEACPHNSSVQPVLFDNHIGVGKCSNLPCYRQKTDAWLADRKGELEREEGKVFLAVEKPDCDRRTVSADVVGEDAFTNDCLNCTSRVRILSGGINKDCGEVIDHQCINLTCFQEKVAAKSEADTPTKSTTTRKTARKKAGSTKGAATRKPSIPGGVKKQAEQYVRGVVGALLLQSPAYRLAISLHSVSQVTGYKIPNLKEVGAEKRIATLAAWDTVTLEAEIDAAIRHGTLTVGFGDNFQGTSVVLASAMLVESRKDAVTDGWKPSTEWLSTYQKGGIESFCRQKTVGFAAAFDAAHEKGAFDKLLRQKKDEIIKAIVEFEFDWTPVAPKEVLDLVG